MYKHIINRMPNHRVYIETHLNDGKVLINKRAANINIAIENNSKTLQNFMKEHYSFFKNGIGFINEDCINYLNEYRFIGEELIYCNLYNFQNKNHYSTSILNLLDSLSCFIMISVCKKEIYSSILNIKKWYIFKDKDKILLCNFNPDEHIKHNPIKEERV